MNTNAIKIKYDSNLWIQGDDIVDDGFTLTESICSKSQIAFGTCEAAAVEVEVISTAASFVGKTIEVYLGNSILGKYTVVSDERASDGETRKLTAYDALYDINSRDVTEWYNNINWESVKNVRDFRYDFFSYLGITQVSATLPNDSMSVSKTMDTTSCSGATVVQAICEINGAFGHINSSGSFQYLFLNNDKTPATIDADDIFDTTTEDFTSPAFDSVLIRTEEGDFGGQYPSTGGNNQYVINGNFLCFGKTGADLITAAQNVSSKIFNRAYIPFTAEIECQNVAALGERVKIPTEPSTFTSYILQRKLVGVIGLEEYYTAQGSPDYVADANSTRNQMLATAQKINKLTTTLDGTISQVKTINDNYVSTTTLSETAKAFNAKVEEIDRELESIVDELDGDVTSFNVEETPTFKKNSDDTLITANYPAIDFTYNIYVHPDETKATLINSDIPFLYSDDGLKTHTRDLATDTTTYHAYRFVHEDGKYYWKQIADSDFGIAMSKIAELDVQADAINQTVTEQGILIDEQGTRIYKAEGQISTQAGQISAKVSKTDGDATTNCSWNLTPEKFSVCSQGIEVLVVDQNGLSVNGSGTFSGTITSNNATITGGSLTVGSNFAVDNLGNLTASNATISGDITTNNATITGGTLAVGEKFSVANDGALTASGATINGDITSNNATITGGSLSVGNNFSVSNTGVLTAKSANISGKITSSSANITGGSLKVGDNFKVTSTGVLTAAGAKVTGTIVSDNAKITGGSLKVGNKFTVTTDGTLTASGANITGAITSSSANITGGSLTIGENFEVTSTGALTATGATINGTLVSDNATITGGSLKVGSYFEVDSDGKLTAEEATINGTLVSDNATITGGSLKVGENFTVTESGNLTAKNANITGTIKSSSATITGGTFKVSTSNASTSAIDLKCGNSEAYISPGGMGLTITDEYGVTNGARLKTDGLWIDRNGRTFSFGIDDYDYLASLTTWNSAGGNFPLTQNNATSFSISGYRTLMLEGYVSGGSAFQTLYIPLATLGTSSRLFAVSLGSAKLQASLSVSGSTLTIRCIADNSSGAWAKAWLQK